MKEHFRAKHFAGWTFRSAHLDGGGAAKYPANHARTSSRQRTVQVSSRQRKFKGSTVQS